MFDVPCAHLIEHDADAGAPRCELGRSIPRDCGACPSYDPGINQQERTRCEVWTRVMGYHRPVSAFNAGKQSEHRDRCLFRAELAEGAGHD